MKIFPFSEEKNEFGKVGKRKRDRKSRAESAEKSCCLVPAEVMNERTNAREREGEKIIDGRLSDPPATSTNFSARARKTL